jgi:hypothetical protein
MDEETVTLLARVSALELLLAKLFAVVYGPVLHMSRDDLLAAHRTLRDVLTTETLVKTKDPALSDLYSAEIEAQIDRFLAGVEKMMIPAPPSRD